MVWNIRRGCGRWQPSKFVSYYVAGCGALVGGGLGWCGVVVGWATCQLEKMVQNRTEQNSNWHVALGRVCRAYFLLASRSGRAADSDRERSFLFSSSKSRIGFTLMMWHYVNLVKNFNYAKNCVDWILFDIVHDPKAFIVLKKWFSSSVLVNYFQD